MAAIGDEAYELYRRLVKGGGHAQASTEAAKTSLAGDFELSKGLERVGERWDDQLRTVVDACAHISNHLDHTKHAHAGEEEYIRVQFSKISELDKGFDEGTRPQPKHGSGDKG